VDTTVSADTSLRPGATDVLINADSVCACRKGKSITLGDCVNFCSENYDDQESLFFDLTLSEAITEDERFGTLNRWCYTEVDTGDEDNLEVNPECTLEVLMDDGSQFDLDVVIPQFGRSLKVNIESIPYGKIAVFRLKVNSNIENAYSSYGQFQKVLNIPSSQTGPLAITTVNRYTCIVSPEIPFGPDGDSVVYDGPWYRIYFYYSVNKWFPVPADAVAGIFCHDYPDGENSYPEDDSPEYPRIEHTTNQFALWNPNDTRFGDVDGNEILEINEILVQLLEARGIFLDENTELFRPFKWLTSPVVDQDGFNADGDEAAQTLGFMLMPFVDEDTNEVFCPDSETMAQYDSPLLEELEAFIPETEGLYMGKEEDPGGSPADQDVYTFLPEGTLEGRWWYTQPDGTKVPATKDDFINRTLYFYFPTNTADPLTKELHQTVFRVTKGGSSSFGNMMIGCVPKI
jgi:hypothetical protein